MTDPLPGDTVCCKVKDDYIVYRYTNKYDAIDNFEVVCLFQNGYLIKVPINLFLKDSFTATTTKIKEYYMPINFVGIQAHFITDSHVVSIKYRKDGEICDRCNEFFSYAEKDKEGKFKCFLCKTYKFR